MFLQYLGLFRKIAKSDIFVVYDTVQYSKNDWHNRNKILTQNGPEWLTVPVSHHLGDSFLVATPAGTSFVQSHLGIITQNYKNAPFFKEIFPKLKEAYEKPFSNLAEFNWNLMEVCIKLLDLKAKIVFSHDLDIAGLHSTEALVKICQLVGADTYLAGMDAGYMKLDQFEKANIKVTYNDFKAVPYPQKGSDIFVPNLSVIDALFNIGPEATRGLVRDDGIVGDVGDEKTKN
jgi:hypothetical protein